MWHIWTIDDWEKNIDLTRREGHRTGLRLRFDKDIDKQRSSQSMQRPCVFMKRIYFYGLMH